MIPALGRWLRQIALAWLCLLSMAAFAASGSDTPPQAPVGSAAPGFSNRVLLTDENGTYLLGRHLLVLEDTSRQLTLSDVTSDKYRHDFVPSTKDVPGYGFTSSVYWVSLEIERITSREQGWMLEFGYAPVQGIDLWTITEDGSTQHQKGGLNVRYEKRPYPHHKHVFELPLKNQAVTRLLLRVDTESSMNIPLRLYRTDTFARASGNERAALSLYAGILIGLLCYNLFIFYSIREPAYLYYVIFLATFLTAIMALNGVAQPLITPNSAYLGVRMIPSSMGLVGASAGLFTMAFLNSRHTMPRLHLLMKTGVTTCIIAFFLPWFASYRLAILLSAGLALAFSSTLFVVAIVAVARGNYSARYYLLAWCVLLIGTMLISAKNFGLLPTNPLTEYSQLWGSAAEAILLSVALAARMRIMKEDTEKAQAAHYATQQALFAAQTDTLTAQAATVTAQQEALSNKQLALDTIQKYSHRLEAEVRKRTEELIQTQQKLVNTEKMAALGVFTAGMAHEINNPANFVSVGAQNASAQIDEFRSFVRDLLADDVDHEVAGAFENRFSKLEKSTATVMEGVTRIQHVIKHLRATHPEGETGLQPAPVVDTLESAWQVVEPTIKVRVSLHASLAARPIIPCLIAELNQAFIALLTNAGHALEDAATTRGANWQGRIDLRSHQQNGELVIEVEDNGPGIDPETLGKIFDPFFTTKTVGRGSGLGLSMARDVVQRHGGTLTATSLPGSGALFMIRLPLTTDTIA